jgi:hypothetical protein
MHFLNLYKLEHTEPALDRHVENDIKMTNIMTIGIKVRITYRPAWCDRSLKRDFS